MFSSLYTISQNQNMDQTQNSSNNDSDFTKDPKFNQLINQIRSDPNDNSVLGFDSDQDVLFDEFSFIASTDTFFPLSNVLPSFVGDNMNVWEENNNIEETSATRNDVTNRRKKVDRSQTLISERRRRSRMKDKLYALRSLVPNITKMDKASIVGDAVLYMQELQMQDKKLKAEIAGLEASLAGAERYKESIQKGKKILVEREIYKLHKNITQLEERGFYVKIVCKKGRGVAASLYKSIESLANFEVQNSNLATTSDSFVFTFSLNATDHEPSLHFTYVKQIVAMELLNQGFEFINLITC